MSEKLTLKVYKEYFDFSAAHFLIFDSKRAERLHGHNYQVRVEMESEPGSLNEYGFFIDFTEIKKTVKALMKGLNEYVLLPEKCPEMKFEEKGPSLHVHFRDRYYVFPRNEVILMPLINTSVEGFSKWITEELGKVYFSQGVAFIQVEVEETSGQAASFRLTNKK